MKNVTAGKKSAVTFLKVNKYENPKNALDLVAHICTQKSDIDVSAYFIPYFEKLEELEKKIGGDEISKSRKDFLNNLKVEGENVARKITEESSLFTIAVAGGYSAGKSSFLNAVTGIGNVLPTGIEPVSMVNTYVNCIPGLNNIVVHGENLSSKDVMLDKEVLACIQHSSKSKVYIASVLNRLDIDIPAKNDLVNNITFIDTPGYNNSNEKNIENNKKDEDTALEAFEEAQAVFWCIDIDAGTVTQNDIKMLSRIEDKPIVIIFTKMDKKPEAEVKKIIDAAKKLCDKQLKNRPVAIVGFSGVEGTGKWSCGKGTIKKLLADLKKKNNESSLLESFTSNYNFYFDYSLALIDEDLKDLEEDRKQAVDEKDKVSKSKKETAETVDFENGLLKKFLIEDYDKMIDAYEALENEWNEILTLLGESLDREEEWSKKVGLFSDSSSLKKKHQKAETSWNKIIKAELYPFPDAADIGIRQNIVKRFIAANEQYNSNYNDYDKDVKKQYEEIVAAIKSSTDVKNTLIKYRSILVGLMQDAYSQAKKKNEKYKRSLQKIKNEKAIDIFAAIASDNISEFYNCFSEGVELSTCNVEGYNPLTYAVKSGNNAMVKFFIENAPTCLDLKDKRGYNTLETAAIMHYRDICEMLLNADNGLRISSQPLDRLANNDNFVKWIKQL